MPRIGARLLGGTPIGPGADLAGLQLQRQNK